MPRKGRRSQPQSYEDSVIAEENSGRSSSYDQPSDGSSSRRRYLVPVQLDKFWGDEGEDLDGWLFHVDSVGQMEQWTSEEKMRRAVVALAGRARTEYRSHMSTYDTSDLLTWDTFRTFLKEQFGPKNPALHWNKKLMSIREGAAETVTAYCSRFRRTLLQLQEASGNPLPDLTVVAWFQEGLRPDLQTELERYLPTKLTDAFRSAEKAERIWKRQQCQREWDVSCFAVDQMSSTVPSAAVHRSRISSNLPPDGGSYVVSPAVPSAVPSSSQLLQQLVSQQSQIIAQQGAVLKLLQSHSQSSQPQSGFRQSTNPQLSASASGHQTASRAFRGQCHYCKKFGHRIAECRKRLAKDDASSRPVSTPVVPASVAHDNDSSGQIVNSVQCDHAALGHTSSNAIPTCNLVVEGTQPVSCVLDSGAVASIVSDHFVDSLDNDVQERVVSADRKTLVAANGGKLTVVGTVVLSLTIGDVRVSHPFTVVRDFAFPVLLGSDFLRDVNAVLDYQDGTVTLWVSPSSKVKLSIVGVVAEKRGLTLSGFNEATGRICAFTSQDRPAVVLDTTDKHFMGDVHSLGSVVDSVRESQNVRLQTTFGFKPSTSVVANTTLDVDQMARLSALIDKYSSVFAHNSDDMGRTTIAHHKIDTGDYAPVNQMPYRLSPSDRENVQSQIETMLKQGIVRDSRSPWASPVILVDKKDGSKRFCVDYRKVNELTKKDRYPIPRVDDSLDLLAGNQYFTCLDLQSGYWQLPVAPEDIEKTAFITPVGLFEFTVMPFGLCNAPSTFQRAMDTVLAGLKWQTCIVYLDDVLIFSPDFATHLTHLESVFQRFQKYNLKLKTEKCNFAQQQLRYLGYLVTPDGLLPDPEKIRAVRDLAVPTTKSQLGSFLGLTAYNRRFVRSYALVASPLTRLLRDDTPFHWDERHQQAFEHLKACLTSPPLLVHPDWDKPFRLQTDASDYAIAAILAQVSDDASTEKVVCYASRHLTDAERKFDTR